MNRLLMAFCGLLVATAAWPTDLYRSSFGALANGPAALPEWNLAGAVYRIQDGWLTVKSAKSNPLATLKTTRDGEGTFRATVRNAQSCHWAGIVAKGVYRLEVNRQHVHCALLRLLDDEWKPVARTPAYAKFAHNTQQFELRLTFTGNRVLGFVDDKRVVSYEETEAVPAGGTYGLVGGWGTDVAWRGISLSDAPDRREWRYEEPPKPAAKGLAQVTWVRGANEDNVYSDSETAGLRFRIKSTGGASRRVVLRYRLIDVKQRQIDSRSATVTLSPNQETELEARFTPGLRGCFKVALDVGADAQNLGWLEDLGSFTVVPQLEPPQQPWSTSYFGGHLDGINLQWHLQAGRKIGLQWARCHNMMQWTWWRRVQPNGPDEWVWGDESQLMVDNEGLRTLGQFLHLPAWASSAAEGAPGNPSAYPPRDWDQLARYVYNTVLRYRGSIKHWEVWNEPHYSGFWRGSPEQYAKLLEIAYREAKSADPECIVLGGGGVHPRSMPWIEAMLQAGGGANMDGFTIHYLEPDLARDFMPRLRQLLDDHGVSGPIWNSEESVTSTSFLDQIRRDYMEPQARYHFRNACYELVRTYMENIANGVERIFYYDQADPWRFKAFAKPRREGVSPVSGAMWDEGRMFKPIAAAHAALAYGLRGKTYSTRIQSGPLRAFIFDSAQTAVAVQIGLLGDYSQTQSLRVPLTPTMEAGSLTVMDFMGNERPAEVRRGNVILPLSREPVYLIYEGVNAGDELGAMYGGAQIAQ